MEYRFITPDGERFYSAPEIIKGFMASQDYQTYRAGAMLERVLLNYMSELGAFGRLTDLGLETLIDELARAEKEVAA